MTLDEKYMFRCLELAAKGAGYASPNPMVGCVIVKNEKIIAEGYHKKYGAFHAERDAITKALKKGINLKGAELYTNLEPCAHFGKTPPCADLVAEHKFSRVIIGVKDPYPLVAGKGIQILKKNGIKITSSVLEDECRKFNKFFFKLVQTGLPYVMIKTAHSIDGKIADKDYNSKWISSPESRKFVHRLRTGYDAVLIGRNTAEYDNPELTVRMVKGRNPYRIVIDKNLTLSLNKKIFSDKFTDKTIVLTSVHANANKIKSLLKRKIIVILCKSKNGLIDLKDALKKLAKLGISSIMVEGGAKTYSWFLKVKLVDEFMIFIAPKIIGEGIDAFTEKFDLSKFKNVTYYKTDRDILVNIK